jgi:hypothetical protein
MSFFDENELDSCDYTKAEADAKSGGRVPPGKYHAVLDGAADVVSANGNAGVELTFKIIAGPFAEKTVKTKIWRDGKDAAKNRAILFAVKCGLLKKNGAKVAKVEGKTDFSDCLNAEVVIEASHRAWKSDDGSKSGVMVEVSYGGIWAMSDPEAKNVAKAKELPTRKEPIVVDI